MSAALGGLASVLVLSNRYALDEVCLYQLHNSINKPIGSVYKGRWPGKNFQLVTKPGKLTCV